LNWTEILAKGGVPESPGYQELLAQIREEKALRGDVDSVPPSRKRKSKRKGPRR
jgi:hypothetical protein